MYKNKFILKLKIFLNYILSFFDLIPSLFEVGYLFSRHSDKFVVILASKSRMNFIKCNNKSNIYKSENYSFIFLCKNSIFTVLVSLIIKFLKKSKKYKFITIISDEKERIGSWDFSLEWNNFYGIKGSRDRAIFTCDDISRPKEKQPLRLYLPIISEVENPNKYYRANHPVFIGIIANMSLEKIKKNEINANSLENDTTDFIEMKEIKSFIRKRWITRLYFVISLKNYFGDWFEIRGIGWGKYNLNAKKIGYSKKNINKKYRDAGICLDFLGTCNNNCLYERSINILNSGGILVQRKSYNSEEVFGTNFLNNYCFEDFEELKNIILSLRNKDNKEIFHEMNEAINNAKDFQKKENNKFINSSLNFLKII